MNKYENIVLINNASPSGNPGTPRNQGISVANGKYIAFVDSDDWIEEDYFETLVKCAVEHDADMVFSGGYVNHTGNKQNTVLYPKRNFYDEKKIDYKYHESFMIWDKIYNANLIKKLEIRLGETKAAVDVPFVLKAYYYLKKVAFCSYVGYHYRRESESSVTKRQRKGTNCDFELQAYSDVFMWAKKYNIDEQYYNIIKLKMVESYLYTLKVINDKNFSDFFYRAKDAFSTVDSGFIGNITKIIKKSHMLKEFECVKKEEPYFFYTNYREKEKINTLCAEQCTFFLPGNKKGILFFPEWTLSNPYQKLFYEALNNQYKITIKGYKPIFFNKDILLKNRVYCDVLHLHWLHSLMDFSSPKGDENFLSMLDYAKKIGYKIVYTAHNIISHDSINVDREFNFRKKAINLFDYILAHGNYAKNELIKKFSFNKKNIFIMYHGLYTGFYQNDLTRVESRGLLNIKNDDFVFCFVGNIKPYKGVERLIEIFKVLALRYRKLKLLIAGKCSPDCEVINITNSIKGCDAIVFRPGYIVNNDIQIFLNAADCMVLPYNSILTSGALMLFLSFHKPVIAPLQGVIPEIIDDKQGFLFSTDKELAAIMENCVNRFEEGKWNIYNQFDFSNLSRFEWNEIVQHEPFSFLFKGGVND